MKTFKEFLLLLEGQQEDLAVKILKRADKLDVLDELRRVDDSDGHKFLPSMAHFYTQENTPLNQIRDIFSLYQNLLNVGKVEPIQYTKSGVLYGKSNPQKVNWVRFTEIVHAADYDKESIPTDISKEDFSELEPVWSNDRYTIYLGDSKRKCIILGKDTPFCISYKDVGNNQYNNYRMNEGITFYFIFDESPDVDKERVVNIGVVGADGDLIYLYTDLENETEETNGEAYLNEYLDRNPDIPKEIFQPVDLSDVEKLIKERFHNKELNLEEFKNLTNVEKRLYIENGGNITRDMWRVMNAKQKNLVVSNTGVTVMDLDFIKFIEKKYLKTLYKQQERILNEGINSGFIYWYREFLIKENLEIIEFGRLLSTSTKFTKEGYSNVVLYKDGKTLVGMIDLTDKEWVIEPEYKRIRVENYLETESLNVVVKSHDNGKFALCDVKNKEFLTDFIYDKIGVTNDDSEIDYDEMVSYYLYHPTKYVKVVSGDKQGVIDFETGEEVLEVLSKYLVSPYIINDIVGVKDLEKNLIGFYDLNKQEWDIEPIFVFATKPNKIDGRTPVSIGSNGDEYLYKPVSSYLRNSEIETTDGETMDVEEWKEKNKHLFKK